MAAPTASTDFVRLLVGSAARAGVPAERLLAPIGVQPAMIAAPFARVPIAVARDAWEQAVRLTGNRQFGLITAEGLEFGTLGLLDYLSRASGSCADVFGHLVRFLPLMADAGQVTFVREGGRARFRHHARDGVPYIAELLLGLIADRARQIFGADWRLERVSFSHRRLGPMSVYERLFECRVTFDAAHDELAFGDDRLHMRPVGAEPRLAELLLFQAQQVVTGFGSTAAPPSTRDAQSFVADFREALREGLARGDASLVTVGERLGMSARSVQRRLKEAGVTHRRLVDELRIEGARRALAGGASQQEISRALGYSAITAFHRAFKRWEGTTPERARAATRPRRLS